MAAIMKRTNSDGSVRWLAQVNVRPFDRVSKYHLEKKQAQIWAKALEDELKKRKANRDAVRPDLANLTLSKLVDEFLADPETKRLRYYEDLERLLAWFVNHYGAMRALELNVLTLREAREKLRRGRMNATANRYLSALRSAWNWARAAGLVPNEKLWPQRLMLTEPNGRTRFLADEELKRLLMIAGKDSPRMLAAVTLSVATGLRQGELLSLDWSDVDFSKRTVQVRHSKNDDPRTVHLPASAADALQALRRSTKVLSAAVFTAPQGARLSKPQLEARWWRIRKLADLSDFRWHDLRHTAASFLAQSGASLVEIGAVLGHRSPSVTQRYAHMVQGAPVTGHDLVDAKLRGAVGKARA
jgi:integrase